MGVSTKYTWHDAKRQTNLDKHHLDFADADLVLESPYCFAFDTIRNGECRKQAFAYVFDVLTVRGLGVRCMLGSVSFWGGFSVGIFKILLLLAIGFVVWGLIRAYQRSLKNPPSPENKKAVETMVKCAHCAVNLPRSEAIFFGDEFYCTPEHQKLGKP